MKRTATVLLGLGLITIQSIGMAANGKNQNMEEPYNQVVQTAMTNQSLSSQEQQTLTYLREEEKLAKDVYQFLSEQWQKPIFGNINNSEDRHESQLKILMEKYQLQDVVSDKAAGVFADPELQTMYDNLTQKGQVSLVDALLVGAMIEELDIIDLQQAQQETDNPELLATYAQLEKGSRNHLRSFVKQLNNAGVDYQAQYLPANDLEKILNSEHEKGI